MSKDNYNDSPFALEQEFCAKIEQLSFKTETDPTIYGIIDYFLVENFIDPNYKDEKGWPLLHLVLRKGSIDLATYLIARGADVYQISDNEERKTAIDIINENNLLHLLILDKNHELSDSLIGLGADVNKFNKDGWAPLHLAIQTGQAQTAQKLINAGAKLDQLSLNDDSKTASDLISIVSAEIIKSDLNWQKLYISYIETIQDDYIESGRVFT